MLMRATHAIVASTALLSLVSLAADDRAAAIATVNARRARASIELVIEPQGTDAIVDVHVNVPDVRDRGRAVVAVALVQSKLSSDVKAGENAGKRLTHDHVVR